MFFKFNLKIIKDLSLLFIIMGFMNVWGYFKWIGRVDVFPLIINNVTGVIAILITSLFFFGVFSIVLLVPSVLCSLSGMQNSKGNRLNRKYNEGCCAITALTAVVTAFTLLLFEVMSYSWWLLITTTATASLIHVIFNFFFNGIGQKKRRKALSRLEIIKIKSIEKSIITRIKFKILHIMFCAFFINACYILFSILIAIVSILPLAYLLQGDIYFSESGSLAEYFIFLVLYLLLFMPVLLSLVMYKKKVHHGIKPVMALSPAIVIAIFAIFSVQLIQINQRSIEIVGMASWHERAFAFKSEVFPAHYFPQDIWGVSKVSGSDRIIEGVELFSNGETHLICPKKIKMLRELALKKNAFAWQVDEMAKKNLTDMNQYCLLAKSEQVRTGAVFSSLFETQKH